MFLSIYKDKLITQINSILIPHKQQNCASVKTFVSTEAGQRRNMKLAFLAIKM